MTWWQEAVGQSAEASRTFREDEIKTYCELTGDAPAVGEVPEPLITGMFSKLLGVDLPGPGTNYLKQQVSFTSTAHTGEVLTAVVEIGRVRPDKRLVDLATHCYGADGRTVCRGRALVLAGGQQVPDTSRAEIQHSPLDIGQPNPNTDT